MRQMGYFQRRRAVRFLGIFVLLCFFAMTSAFSEENGFSVQRVGQMRGNGKNAFSVQAPEAGYFSVTVRDAVCTYRVIRIRVQEGITEVPWDGCGYNGEPMEPKYYYFDFLLEADSGENYTYFFESPIVESLQHLQFVLPSGGTAWLSAPEEWFVELKVIRDGSITTELIPEGTEEPAYLYNTTVHLGRVEHFTLEKLARRNLPIPGYYTVRIFEDSRPDEITVFPLQIEADAPTTAAVTVTGEIMPAADASDGEIWQKMMQHSVVVDLDPLDHQNIYAEADEKSESLGTLHGTTQCVEVFKTEGDWAKIGAWNHEEGEYIEGWVPLNRLKTAEPNREYGLLIDKKSQTMTVFREGVRIETLQVSTGKMDRGHYDRETSAGCYLTGLHRVDFSMWGSKYDFVIQYDGGNLLHQIPYSSDGKRDFTVGKEGLGKKASHACIRIQDEPGEMNGINAYWIWTHIPTRTRVIILDDPEERRAEKAQLCGEE